MNAPAGTLAIFIALTIEIGTAPRGTSQSSPGIDYADGANWLCRPGRTDACAIDLTTTIVAADGTLTREPWTADPKAPIDCFYVYPTVSADPTRNSDMTPGPEERRIVASQFARFASQCRPFAPLYRQISLAGLRAGIFGPIDGSDLLSRSTGTPEREFAYNDVRDAWNYYLQHDNHGRGVVLIGHSQGAFLLATLIQREIDGRPSQSKLVSAILLGMSVPVRTGAREGGAFQRIPLCRTVGDTGCVISYAAFRSTTPPPAKTLFGRVSGDGMTSACTNPAALAGGSAELHAYLDAAGHPFASATRPLKWTAGPATIDTRFVSVPGLLTARCVANDRGSYLEVTVHGDPGDPRADDIAGDMKTEAGAVDAAWGLHLVDVNLTLGNLLDAVRAQAAAYRRQNTTTKTRRHEEG
jgi:Protein of unknown function (DUF3089)